MPFFSAKISFGVRHARLLDIALLTFSPIYLYAGFAYTDTAGLLCVSLLILQFLKLRAPPPGSRSYLRKLITYALAAALTFRVKVMSFIVFLATTLGVLLHKKIRFQSAVREVAAAAFMCALFIAVLSLPIHHFTLLPDDRTKADQFPLEHWIVMGFNHYGGYSQEDVDYSKSFDSYDARRDALRARLIERLTGRTLTENSYFVFHTKLNCTWGNALLAGDDYMSRSALFPESLVQRVWGWYGDLHDYCKIPAYGFWLLLVTGCLLSGIFSWKSASISYLHLSLLGVFAFLSFWECNSRYLFTFIPVLFLCSFKGWNDSSTWLLCHSHFHGDES